MASDGEIRGRLLSVVYDLRHQNGGWVPISEQNFSGLEAVSTQAISTIAQHLSAVGLIEWQGYINGGGIAKITGIGVDVIEGNGPSPLHIVLPEQTSAKENAPDTDSRFIGVSARAMAGEFAPSSRAVTQQTQRDPTPPVTTGPVQTTVGIAVLQNHSQIALISESLVLLIDEKIASLKSELPNSEEGKDDRDQEVAEFEILKAKLEALQHAALEFSADQSKEETIVKNSRSFADGIAGWWKRRHLQICERAYDMALFTLGVSVCAMAGSGGEIATVVSGALIGGKPVIEAIKAAMKRPD